MVELRKRKAPPPEPEKPAKRKAAPRGKAPKVVDVVKEKAANAVETVKEAVGANTAESEAQKASTAPASAPGPSGPPKVGDTISLDGFGGEVETHDGKKVTLKQLVDESKAGVVLFTYPKASTPGCTTQACAFRDGHATLTGTGLTIYGLSADGPKANTSFRTKHAFPYTLLCDPKFSLIAAVGLTARPGEKKTKRGVFAVDKHGKVLLAETGGPLPTVDAVKRLVDGQRSGVGKTKGTTAAAAAALPAREPSKEDKEAADTAGEVADTAAKLDAPPSAAPAAAAA